MWTPSYTGLTVGNGVVTARYTQAGRITDVYWAITLGTTSAVTGAVTIGSIPVASANSFQITSGNSCYLQGRSGIVVASSTTTVVLKAIDTSAAYATAVDLSATIPVTWANAFVMGFILHYEGAT